MFRQSWLATLVVSVLVSEAVSAGEKSNPAITPSPRMNKEQQPDPGWMKRHDGFVEIAKKGGVDLLFLGDSITDAWRSKAAQPTWEKYFVPHKPANFGIGGDRTQHVLWRITNGELDGISPKVAVLMIGTNNTGQDSAEQIAEGITVIVKAIRQRSPSTKVLLLAVFPRGEKADNPGRTKIAQINKVVSKLDDGKNVRFLDIGGKFLAADGVLTKEIMPDYLHLSARGYEIWGESINPLLKEMLRDTAAAEVVTAPKKPAPSSGAPSTAAPSAPAATQSTTEAPPEYAPRTPRLRGFFSRLLRR